MRRSTYGEKAAAPAKIVALLAAIGVADGQDEYPMAINQHLNHDLQSQLRSPSDQADSSHRPGAARFWPISLLIVAAILVTAVWLLAPSGRGAIDPKAASRAITTASPPTSAEEANIKIYEQASPCLVQVTNLAQQSDLFGTNEQQVPQGVGSGFVWDTDGHIVTNYHVVEGADSARVTLADQSTYIAKQISAFQDQDMAVLWIDAPKNKLHPIPVGTSHDLKVGQIVYALGDPFGLDKTMTTGIVSALGREIESTNGRRIRGVIQTSAPLNPGNSGGPLIDSSGRLIGMDTAIVSPSGAFAGIGFAIPVDEINQIVPELIQHGKVVRPRLGVQLAEDQLAEQLGINEGALIIKVLPNSAAASAGLRGTQRDPSGQIQLGDVIVAVDGKAVQNAKQLGSILQDYHVGDKVTVGVLRGGQRQDVAVTLTAEQ